jgi:hypothetical protein
VADTGWKEERTISPERKAVGQTALFLLAKKALKNQRKQNSVWSTGKIVRGRKWKETGKEKSKTGRADEFILFAVFRAFAALKKKFSLGLLFLLGQSKRKAKKKKNDDDYD